MFLSISKSKWQKGFHLGLFYVILCSSVVGFYHFFIQDLKNNSKELVYVKTSTELENDESIAYVPGIAIIKSDNPNPVGVGPCRQIEYTYFITNESTNGEILENVEVIDLQLSMNPLPGPSNGDDNNNTFLDPGEIWGYTFAYFITSQDKINGQVGGNATVTADVQGQGISVNDTSDDDSVLGDEPTITDLTACQPTIAIVKTGILAPGCDNIRYRFDVTNESLGGDILENIQVFDPLIDDINPLVGPQAGFNGDGDNLLEIGEVWSYFETYDLTQADKNNGEVVNQAHVTSTVVGFPNALVEDDSDDNSVLEDDPTVTDLSACQPRVAMVKTGTVNNDCSQIEYTFYVSNTGAQILTNVEVIDPLFANELGNNPIPDLDPCNRTAIQQ